MASEVPGPDLPARGTRRRGWHEYRDYRIVHENQLHRLTAAGIVAGDSLYFEERAAGATLVGVRLYGRVETASGAVLSVEKRFDLRRVRARTEIRTAEYRYHAFLPGPPAVDLFRYDNCHGGLETLHRHSFGPEGRETGIVEIAHDAMPWLSEVIEETDRVARPRGGRG